MLIILFGVPGAGKNYVGHIFADAFGYAFYDADHDLPDDMRHALKHKLTVTDDMRDRFFAAVLASIDRLTRAYERVVVAQALVKERHRLWIADRFPAARFILIESEPALIEERFAQRADYLIDLDQARRIAAAFEPTALEHHVINNDNGRQSVEQQIRAILDQLALPRR